MLTMVLAVATAAASSRRGGRVVDGSGLENQHVRKGIVGSNPTLSVLTPVTGGFLMVHEVSGSLQCN